MLKWEAKGAAYYAAQVGEILLSVGEDRGEWFAIIRGMGRWDEIETLKATDAEAAQAEAEGLLIQWWHELGHALGMPGAGLSAPEWTAEDDAFAESIGQKEEGGDVA